MYNKNAAHAVLPAKVPWMANKAAMKRTPGGVLVGVA